MTDATFRVFCRAIGVVLLLLGGFLMWETLWARNGMDAFLREWGEPLAKSADPARWARLRPDVLPPDTNRVAETLEMLVGWRISRLGLAAFIGCELIGALLVLGSIRRTDRTEAS